MNYKTMLAAVSILAIGNLYADDKPLAAEQIPAQIKSYIDTHFAGTNITKATIDDNDSDDKYEITLSGNIELDFAADFSITDIDANSKLPASVIPAKIADYVSANYPNNVITDWSLEDNAQQLELDNQTELEFSLTGDFIRIDD